MSEQPFQEDGQAWRRSANSSQGRRYLTLPPSPFITAAIVGLLLVVLAVVPGPHLQAVVSPATRTPTGPLSERCRSGEAQRGRNSTLAADQRWAQVIDETLGELYQPGLCPNDRLALRGELLDARMELLLSYPIIPNDRRQQQIVLQHYHAICNEAQVEGIALPSDLDIARRAYAVGAFLLARTAFENAWSNGTFHAYDQEYIRQYASTLYNLGYWWTRSDEEATYKEGLTLLAASYVVDQHFAVNSGAAEELLIVLVGPDKARWPEPAQTPLFTDRG